MLPAKKSLGQHFLRDPNTASRISELIVEEKGQHIIEIGPGDGFLTHHLLHRTSNILAIELDQRAVAVLNETMPDLEVIRMDVLKADWSDFRSQRSSGERLRVVGNLPYYITSQILFSLLRSHEHIERAVIMSQYEVAKRIVGVPRTKDYGILSIMTQLFSEPKLEFKLGPHVFRPKPRVDSAILSLNFHPNKDMTGGLSWDQIMTVVKTAFGQRRKTMRNSLAGLSKEKGKSIPKSISSRRPEELTPEEFVELASYFYK